MALALLEDLKNLVNEGEAKVKDFFEARAPEIDHIAQTVEKVAGDPLVQALLASVHITPGMVQALADLVQKWDGELGAAKEAAVQASQVPPADEPPAE